MWFNYFIYFNTNLIIIILFFTFVENIFHQQLIKKKELKPFIALVPLGCYLKIIINNSTTCTSLSWIIVNHSKPFCSTLYDIPKSVNNKKSRNCVVQIKAQTNEKFTTCIVNQFAWQWAKTNISLIKKYGSTSYLRIAQV